MSRKNIILVVLVLVLLGAGIWIGSHLSLFSSDDSPYTAVYLTTGDIYFGEMHWFPKPHMDNAYYLQRGVDQQNKPQLAIVPMKNTFWGSASTVYFNKQDIVFWSKLRADSQVAQYLSNPNSANGNLPNGAGLPSGSKAATSTAP